jgi:hypothetical protein
MDEQGAACGSLQRRRLLLARGAALLLWLSMGSAGAAGRPRAAFAALLEWLPGNYLGDTSRLELLPVYAPLTGPHAFYLRESDLVYPARVLDQRLLAVTAAKRGRAALRVWQFADPARWREAHLATDLFKGLMPGDVVPGAAIEIDWLPGRTRLGARAGAAFPFELDTTALVMRTRFERDGSTLP